MNGEWFDLSINYVPTLLLQCHRGGSVEGFSNTGNHNTTQPTNAPDTSTH